VICYIVTNSTFKLLFTNNEHNTTLNKQKLHFYVNLINLGPDLQAVFRFCKSRQRQRDKISQGLQGQKTHRRGNNFFGWGSKNLTTFGWRTKNWWKTIKTIKFKV